MELDNKNSECPAAMSAIGRQFTGSRREQCQAEVKVKKERGSSNDDQVPKFSPWGSQIFICFYSFSTHTVELPTSASFQHIHFLA